MPQPPKLFISYRRVDSRKDAGRIYDRMVDAFGRENIFMDVDSIPTGADFREAIQHAVDQCDAMLVIIGNQWLTVTDSQGKRRLDNPADYVRLEVLAGLRRKIVFPVLVDNAPPIAPDQLPSELHDLAFINAIPVRDDRDFHSDVGRLLEDLESRYGMIPMRPGRTHVQPSTGDVHTLISRFYQACDEREWEAARTLLTQIRASGKVPRVFKIDDHEKDVWAAIESEERDKEYNLLRVMAQVQHPNAARFWEALQTFWEIYPDYDPDDLSRFRPAPTIRQISPPPPIPRSKVLEILPRPFEWIDIPAGKVTLEQGGYLNASQTFDVPAFTIGKYPITNTQFAKFIEAGGYKQELWWTDAGWDAKAKGMDWDSKKSQWVETNKAWTQPRYWTDARWNGAEHPVVGVSWYEAIAFCNWLTKAFVGTAFLPSDADKPDTQKRVPTEIVTLPTEQQWQRAAQSDQGLTYPWGNEFDAARCNTSESKIGKTTPVTQYAGKGDSPFGVTDMSGNVWEWCLIDYHASDIDLEGTGVRVLHGGSWSGDQDLARAAYRNNWNPSSRNLNFGFRVVVGGVLI